MPAILVYRSFANLAGTIYLQFNILSSLPDSFQLISGSYPQNIDPVLISGFKLSQVYNFPALPSRNMAGGQILRKTQTSTLWTGTLDKNHYLS